MKSVIQGNPKVVAFIVYRGDEADKCATSTIGISVLLIV
jgi:hypothetical protein